MTTTAYDDQFAADELEYLTIGDKQYALTPEFPGDVKPVYVGWYQRKFFGSWDTDYDFWDTGHWRYRTPEGQVGEISGFQTRPWRGLAECPFVAIQPSLLEVSTPFADTLLERQGPNIVTNSTRVWAKAFAILGVLLALLLIVI